MRPLCSLLAAIVWIAVPLSAEAGPRRGPARGGFRQPQAYRKPQTITPENPALVQARQQRLEKLKADLDAIGPKATPTPEQTAALYQDLMAVVDGSSKPAPASVRKLAADLAATLSRRAGGPSLDTLQLAQALKVVMNSAYELNVNSHSAAKASEKLLKAGGIAEPDAQSVADDLKAIATQAAAQGRPGMIR